MSESWKCCWDLVLPECLKANPHCPVQLILLWRLQKLISRPVVVVKRGESLINLPKPLRWKTNITSHDPFFFTFSPPPTPPSPNPRRPLRSWGGWEEGKRKRAGDDAKGEKRTFLSSHCPPYTYFCFVLLLYFFIIEIASRSFWGKESTGY